jgi:hypothetical protein
MIKVKNKESFLANSLPLDVKVRNQVTSSRFFFSLRSGYFVFLVISETGLGDHEVTRLPGFKETGLLVSG